MKTKFQKSQFDVFFDVVHAHARVSGPARLLPLGALRTAMASLMTAAVLMLVIPANARPIDDEVATYLAKKLVTAQLKDPDSARFSGIHGVDLPSVPGTPINGWSVICGLVNSKNSFGGYAGDERFVVIVTSATNAEVDFEQSMKRRDFAKAWQICDW